MSILKFMPKKEKMEIKNDLVFVQAKVSPDLRARVKAELRKNKYTIQELIENSFLAYLDETKRQAAK